MDQKVQSVLVALAIVVAIFSGLFFAYNSGLLDPMIEKIGVYLFKAKAMAEKKKLQAQGLKAGDDFIDEQLDGNKQAAEVMDGASGFGSLKKEL